MTTLLLALLALSPGDVTVCRSTEIESERPIAEIVLEGALGLINGERGALGQGNVNPREALANAAEAITQDGVIPVLRRVLKVLGFALWDREGEVTYAYQFAAGAIHIRRWARISNGHVKTTVTLTGDLGEKRLRSITLELEANEKLSTDTMAPQTIIHLVVMAEVELRGRIGARLVDRIAGPRLCEQLADLEAAGRKAVRAGESGINAMIFKFVQRHQSKGGR